MHLIVVWVLVVYLRKVYKIWHYVQRATTVKDGQMVPFKLTSSEEILTMEIGRLQLWNISPLINFQTNVCTTQYMHCIVHYARINNMLIAD